MSFQSRYLAICLCQNQVRYITFINIGVILIYLLIYPNLSCCISHNKFNSEYTIHGNAIPYSSSCKDLGINSSDNSSWRLHYQTITSKAYKSLGLLRRIFHESDTVLWQEKTYTFQSLDLLCYILFMSMETLSTF